MELLFFSTLIFTALLPTVWGQITCYSCLSTNDDRCGDYFQPLVPSYECPGSCMKYRGERWSNNVRIVEVYRLCGETMSEGCQNDVSYNGLNTRRCACNTNLCNLSNRLSAAIFVNLIAMILVKLMT